MLHDCVRIINKQNFQIQILDFRFRQHHKPTLIRYKEIDGIHIMIIYMCVILFPLLLGVSFVWMSLNALPLMVICLVVEKMMV